jgi:hypothetical protein
VIHSIRVSDIPKFVIGLAIAMFLFRGLIALWKSTGGMPAWLFYSLFVGIVVVSFVATHLIWKVACNAWRKNKVRR